MKSPDNVETPLNCFRNNKSLYGLGILLIPFKCCIYLARLYVMSNYPLEDYSLVKFG